ncbi:hypothetical protein HK101_001950, partial [Irineochytrium annulatum]
MPRVSQRSVIICELDYATLIIAGLLADVDSGLGKKEEQEEEEELMEDIEIVMSVRSIVENDRYLTPRQHNSVPKTTILREVLFALDDDRIKRQMRMTKLKFTALKQLISDDPV